MEKEQKIALLAEIYSMQADLNRKTLGNINVDWDEILCSAQGECTLASEDWIENYRKALTSEFVEYLASDKHTKNAKIEVVDILHFLVSLAEITGIPPFTAIDCCDDPVIFNGVALSRAILVTLDDLQCSIPWKWWGTGGSFQLDKAQVAIEDLFSIFGIIMGEMDMEWAEIHDIYKKKNAVNHQRQDNGYDLSKKTEADNESIEVSPSLPISPPGETSQSDETDGAIDEFVAKELYSNTLYNKASDMLYRPEAELLSNGFKYDLEDNDSDE